MTDKDIHYYLLKFIIRTTFTFHKRDMLSLKSIRLWHYVYGTFGNIQGGPAKASNTSRGDNFIHIKNKIVLVGGLINIH